MRNRFCENCANMYPVSIAGGSTQVLCLASARFTGGPLRHDVDVAGIVKAERRNADNQCTGFSRVNPGVRKYRRWIERYGNGERSRLEDYPRRIEQGLPSEEDSQSSVEDEDNSETEIREVIE